MGLSVISVSAAMLWLAAAAAWGGPSFVCDVSALSSPGSFPSRIEVAFDESRSRALVTDLQSGRPARAALTRRSPLSYGVTWSVAGVQLPHSERRGTALYRAVLNTRNLKLAVQAIYMELAADAPRGTGNCVYAEN